LNPQLKRQRPVPVAVVLRTGAAVPPTFAAVGVVPCTRGQEKEERGPPPAERAAAL